MFTNFKTITFATIFIVFSFTANAQVCWISKDKNSGEIIRHFRMQFGKDTVQMGVPFKAMQKLGMSISLQKGPNAGNYFSLALRTNDPRIYGDTIDIHQLSLLFTMNNGDTVKIKAYVSPNAIPHSNMLKEKNGLGLSFFMNSYLSLQQLNKLNDGMLASVEFCKSDDVRVPLPVRNRESNNFKYAMTYLMKVD